MDGAILSMDGGIHQWHATSTASVQRVVEQELGTEKSTIIIESDLSHPSLLGAIQGHVVNGGALCPSVSASVRLK